MDFIRGILSNEVQSVRLILASKVNKILLAGHAESFDSLRKSSSSFRLDRQNDNAKGGVTYFRSMNNERLMGM